MAALAAHDVQRLLVVMPNWLGDTIMATPTLRALRCCYPRSYIAVLIRPKFRRLLEGAPWVDRFITVRKRRPGRRDGRRRGFLALASHLRAGRFDTAILLRNSFDSGLLVWLARIPKRIGYVRDGRSLLLTDRLQPLRHRRRFVPVSARDYYLEFVLYLGGVDPDPNLRLFTRPQDDARVDELFRSAGPEFDLHSGRPLVLLNPGATFGDAKIWHPERFAAVANRCLQEFNAVVALNGTPAERPILDQVCAATRPVLNLLRYDVDLRLLKSIVSRASVMVTNDTGPRHIAAAVGTPVVTIFGPTDPAWSEIGFPLERQIMVPVPCGPCMKPVCPLDHRCMTRISPDVVFERVAELIRSGP